MNMCETYNRLVMFASKFGVNEYGIEAKSMGPFTFVFSCLMLSAITIFLALCYPIVQILKLIEKNVPDIGLSNIFYRLDKWWKNRFVHICPIEMRKKDCKWHTNVFRTNVNKQCTNKAVLESHAIAVGTTLAFTSCKYIPICAYYEE